MNVANLIRGEKTALNLGAWGAGHLPRSAFPLSKVKEKQYRYGPAYKWRLIQFQCHRYKCRLLIILNRQKELFRLRFGVENDGNMVVLLDREFHGTKPGWNCHFTLDKVVSVVSGAVRGPGKRRWPRGCDPEAKFTVTEANALTVAAQMFQFGASGGFI